MEELRRLWQIAHEDSPATGSVPNGCFIEGLHHSGVETL